MTEPISAGHVDGPSRADGMLAASLKRHLRGVLWKTFPRLYRNVVRHADGQVFSIGILRGESPFLLRPEGATWNPVLTALDVDDVPASFVADPFVIRWRDGYFMFFEVMNGIRRRGEIGLASSGDGLRWEYERVVLTEPFHLAYPYVFGWQGEVFMVPDSPGQGIRLYRAIEFPYRWEQAAQITAEGGFSDASPFEHDGAWWLLSGWARTKQDPMSLRLFRAETPLGPWHEHPASPIVHRDDRISRPAGRVKILGGHPHRFTQDCEREYGRCVRAFRIEQLTATCYRETLVSETPLLSPGSDWWNLGGMHHIDAHQAADGSWTAYVDGWHQVDRGG